MGPGHSSRHGDIGAVLYAFKDLHSKSLVGV